MNKAEISINFPLLFLKHAKLTISLLALVVICLIFIGEWPSVSHRLLWFWCMGCRVPRIQGAAWGHGAVGCRVLWGAEDVDVQQVQGLNSVQDCIGRRGVAKVQRVQRSGGCRGVQGAKEVQWGTEGEKGVQRGA